MKPEEIIIRPIITEKSQILKERQEYVFEVHKEANKPQIKKAVEDLFKVKVKKIKVINVKPKRKFLARKEGQKKGYKKAIVTLEKGFKIEFE